MFTIDLLKREGIPAKSRPETIVMTAVTIAVPAVIALALVGFYFRSRIVMSLEKQTVTAYQTKIAKLAETAKQQQAFEDEDKALHNCLSEVASCVGGNVQWTPILAALVSNMPDSMILTKLEVRTDSILRKVASKDNPDQKVDIAVPLTTLHLNLSGPSGSNNDKEVRDFRDRLRTSRVLGPVLDDIKVSQEMTNVDGKDVVSYKLDCFFKSKI